MPVPYLPPKTLALLKFIAALPNGAEIKALIAFAGSAEEYDARAGTLFELKLIKRCMPYPIVRQSVGNFAVVGGAEGYRGVKCSTKGRDYLDAQSAEDALTAQRMLEQANQDAERHAREEKKDILVSIQRRKDRRDKYILVVLGPLVGYVIGRFGDEIEQLIRSAFALLASLFH